MTPATARPGAWALPILMLAAFAAATGYGIVLPRLPALLAALPEAGDAAWRTRHVSGLTAAFFGAALVAAPLWGWLSDRLDRRLVLAVGAAGFAVAFVASERVGSLPGLYLARALDGAFAAAVAPTALAYLADRWRDPDQRARRFAWLNAAVLAGYLAGPLLAEALAPFGRLAPFVGPAVASGVAALLMGGLAPPAKRLSPRARAGGRCPRRIFLLALAAVAAGAVVVQEIASSAKLELAAEGRLSMALLLSFCGAVMFLTQVVIFAGKDAAKRAIGLLRPLLLALALALATSPLLAGFWWQALAITLVASAAAALNVLSAYLTSQLKPDGQGEGLGLQYAAASAGQLTGALGVAAAVSAGSPWALWSAAALALGLALVATARPPDAA